MSACRGEVTTQEAHLCFVRHVVGLHHIRFLLEIPSNVSKGIRQTRSRGERYSNRVHLVLHTNFVVDNLIKDRRKKLFR